MDGLNSNLNLNGSASPRAIPRLGEWGPDDVPSTRQKKRQRWVTIAALVVVLAVVFTAGALLWTMLH